MVVKRGTNDHEIVPLARHFRDALRPGRGPALHRVHGRRRHQRLAHGRGAAFGRGGRAPVRGFPAAAAASPTPAGETAERWRYVDGGGEIGVISSVTQAFCRDCNRARLSTEGKLFLCLFASRGHDLRALLRGQRQRRRQIDRGAIGLDLGRAGRPLLRTARRRHGGGRQRRAPRRDALHRRLRRAHAAAGRPDQSATACAISGVMISPGTFLRANSV